MNSTRLSAERQRPEPIPDEYHPYRSAWGWTKYNTRQLCREVRDHALVAVGRKPPVTSSRVESILSLVALPFLLLFVPLAIWRRPD